MQRVRLVVLFIVLFSACTPAAKSASELVYGLTLSPTSMDPHVGASSELGIPLTSVYDPLVWLSPDGEFVPGLAERWEIADDGKTYTFDLRTDVTFHDDTPFDAEAVCYNLNRIADPATRSAKAVTLLGPFEACAVLDEHTAQVSFSTAYAPFLSAVSQVYLAMASPTAIERWGEDYQFHQVGTGPFRFQEYLPKDHLTLTRNPDYDWGPTFFSKPGQAYLEKIEFRFYVDPATRAPALESGEVHIMGEIPPIDAARLDGDPRFRLLQVPVPGQPLQMYLNVTHPPTDELKVRQALLYATDRQAIVDSIFMGYSPPAYGPLNRPTFGYWDGVEAFYPHDPERARQLLAEAGWTDTDNDGIRDKEGVPLVLRAFVMGWGFLPEVGQILQQHLSDVGVQLDVQLVAAYPMFIQTAAESQHHLIPFTFSSSDPHILYSSFHSTNADRGFNWSKVKNDELDRLLEMGMREQNTQERAEIYAAIQELIMAEALILPIREYVNLNATSSRVQGLLYDAQGWFPLLHDVRIVE